MHCLLVSYCKTYFAQSFGAGNASGTHFGRPLGSRGLRSPAMRLELMSAVAFVRPEGLPPADSRPTAGGHCRRRGCRTRRYARSFRGSGARAAAAPRGFRGRIRRLVSSGSALRRGRRGSAPEPAQHGAPRIRPAVVRCLVESFGIEPFPDFSAK